MGDDDWVPDGPDGPWVPDGPIVDGPVVGGPVLPGGPLPNKPKVPEWVYHPKDTILEIVVGWLVGGLWKVAVTVATWILTLFRVAFIEPFDAAGSSVIDATRPIGETLIDLAWSLSDPLREVAGDGPFSIIIVAFASGVFVVVLAVLARAGWAFLKGVNPY